MVSKKFVRLCLSICLLATLLTGCTLPTADGINSTVTLPSVYRITYEVKASDGVIHTVSRAQDANGNLYFRSGVTELLFLKDGNDFVLYEKDENGAFTTKEGIKVDQEYAKEATEEFFTYAEQSKKKYLPGIKETGEATVLNRTCKVFEVSVGIESHRVSYSYYVDTETGVCLGFDSSMILANISLDTNDTVFTCTEFATECADLATLRSEAQA
ncbi:MAG: hypothetical protein IJY42_04475 [Clostridia bacterium]|nr:hypothetical protein [Clostridia bacterium]